MFDQFSERAKRVIFLMREVASTKGNTAFIEPCHLLYGLVREDQGEFAAKNIYALSPLSLVSFADALPLTHITCATHNPEDLTSRSAMSSPFRCAQFIIIASIPLERSASGG